MNTIQETIGKLIEGDYQRDAIHIAVAPVTADEILYPGQRVEFVEGKQGRVKENRRASHVAVGIIDPFLDGRIYPDQKCWLFLFPNTITGMRHEWQHPAFERACPGWGRERAAALGSAAVWRDLAPPAEWRRASVPCAFRPPRFSY